MTLKVNIAGKIAIPKINFQPELEKIAMKVIRPDIQKRMKKGIDINGQAHKANTTSTRLNKGLRGLKTEVPLIASGQLVSSFRVTFKGKDAVKIFPAGTRKAYPNIKKGYRLKGKNKKSSKEGVHNNFELADILQKKGVRRGGHKYEFFGISKEAEAKAIKTMQSYIRKAIKDAKR